MCSTWRIEMDHEIRVLEAGSVAKFFSDLTKDLKADTRRSCSRCGNEVPKIKDLCEYCERIERGNYFNIY